MGARWPLTASSTRRWHSIERLLEIEPTYPEAHNSLGVALVSGAGRRDEAFLEFQRP